jgi:tetratricopeptide (TPR) repeat protein
MIDFRTDCKALFPPKSAENEVARYLERQISEFTPLFLQFYWHFSSIVAVEYFRHRKKEGRKALLVGKYPLRYDQTDARKARELLGKLFGSPAHASPRLSDAAAYFSMMGLHQISIVLYEDIRQSKDESLVNQAITSENIAIEYRWLGNYKLMLRYAKEALQLYGKAEKRYRYCVCLKNIGEAEWMLGFQDRARKCFEEAEAESLSFGQSEHFAVLFNIAMTYSRVRNRRGELNYLKKSLIICPEDQTERILWINDRINQLVSFGFP